MKKETAMHRHSKLTNLLIMILFLCMSQLSAAGTALREVILIDNFEEVFKGWEKSA
ncbi:MAG: hypothetical protein ACYSSP_06925 [Planctomycetota bacterium]